MIDCKIKWLQNSKIAFNLLIFQAFSLAILIILAGCGSTNPDNPPKINLGQDPCDNCFMIINELKYASAIRLENGETKRFDDIGCMIDYLNKNDSKVKTYWVYNFINKEPMHVEDVYFVDSDSLTTPMGFGIVAFKSKEQAAKIADKYKTKIISFNELKNKYHKIRTE